jgi:hypothetical protein
VTNGDVSGTDPFTGITVGASNVGSSESDTQSIQISGAGAILPSGYSGFVVTIPNNNLNTWDSYNFVYGYVDVFASVLSDKGYYWNLSNTNIHPLINNTDLIIGHESSNPAIPSYWGGIKYGDGKLDINTYPTNFIFNTDPSKTYYLTLFLQTTKDTEYPSWGTVSGLTVDPIPEPASVILFGMSLLGFGIIRRKRRG